MPAHEIIGNRRDEERGHVRAHVPAIGQQRHRVRKNAGGDFDHHHHASNGDDDAGTAFALREVAHEIVSLPEMGMICPIHLTQRYCDYRVSKKAATLACAQPTANKRVAGHGNQ